MTEMPQRSALARGYALRAVGASLALLALGAAAFVWAAGVAPRPSAVELAVFTDAPLRDDPTIALLPGGGALRVTPPPGSASYEIVLRGVLSCSVDGRPTGARLDGMLRVDVAAATRVVCLPERADRPGAIRRKTRIGMLWPTAAAAVVRRGFTPAHELRVTTEGGDGVRLEGGLQQPLFAPHGRELDAGDERFLSRYRVAFAPSVRISWSAPQAVYALIFGLALAGALLGLLGHGLWELFLPSALRRQ